MCCVYIWFLVLDLWKVFLKVIKWVEIKFKQGRWPTKKTDRFKKAKLIVCTFAFKRPMIDLKKTYGYILYRFY